MAGTVGALDNGIGVVGVAPGVRLWSVRILDSAGIGLISWYVCGLDWITAQRDPADPTRPLFEAVNMSVAKRGTDDGACGIVNNDLIHQAVCRLVASGVTVVAAAGNNGFNAANLKPASYNEVITVSALADTDGKAGGAGGALCYSWGTYDRDDTFADFSNYGGDVDLIAPGKCIWSTLPGNRYGYISGTSMAAPHVAGAAALYKSSRPLASPAQVRSALRAAGTLDWNTATDPDSVHEPLLDVSRLVALGDFTLDATPGTSRSALVGAGRCLSGAPRLARPRRGLPQRGAAHRHGEGTAHGDPRHRTRSYGLDQVATTMRITVPAGTPSGSTWITVTADDGTRERASAFPVGGGQRARRAPRPRSSPCVPGRVSGAGLNSVGTWAAASDVAGTIARYEVRWRVDGSLGSPDDAVRLDPPGRSQDEDLATPTPSACGRVTPPATGAHGWRARPFAPVLSQDTSPTLAPIRRPGRATTGRGCPAARRSTRARGARGQRSFTGRAIALVGSKSPGRGKAKVYIDGVLAATVDFRRSSAAHRQVVFTRSWATARPRTLKVVVLGTSGRPRVDVDAFVIVP